jgi:selenocysteine-specific elongation factor
LRKVKIYKNKQKEGGIDRVADAYNLIGKNLFKKEADMNMFVGLKVQRTSNGKGK